MASRALEQFHINRFIAAANLEIPGEIEWSESPDCLFLLNGRRIGLEHTQFFFPTPEGQPTPQMISALQRIAIEQARRLFRARGGPALYVTPYFQHDQPRTKRQAYALGERFADLVAFNGWPGPSEGSRIYDAWPVIPEIHAYSVMGSIDGHDELWSSGGGGWIANVEPEHIMTCLAGKDSLYETYASRADEVWLLIANDMFRGGAPCRLGSAAQSFQYQFKFDRVFWFDTSNSDVVQFASVAAGTDVYLTD